MHKYQKQIKKSALHCIIDRQYKTVYTINNIIQFDFNWEIDRFIKDKNFTTKQVKKINYFILRLTKNSIFIEKL